MDNQAEFEKWRTPVCDACKTPLVIHGSSLAGQSCDLRLAARDFTRGLFEALGSLLPHRGDTPKDSE